jgi:hypothetical protein
MNRTAWLFIFYWYNFHNWECKWFVNCNMARKRSEHPFTGPEPPCGISRSCQVSGQGLDEQKSHKTMGIHNWSQTKEPLPEEQRICWNRDQLRWIVGLFTGHCRLKGHLFKLGLTDDPICERCLEEDESSTHSLCDSEAIAHLRFRHLGLFFVEPSDFYDAPISKVGAGIAHSV